MVTMFTMQSAEWRKSRFTGGKAESEKNWSREAVTDKGEKEKELFSKRPTKEMEVSAKDLVSKWLIQQNT